jgi:hypothetical protein
MGVDVGDLNGDGLIDLWVVNFEQEIFAAYQNVGNSLFLHASESMGLAAEAGLYVGWGTSLCDLDRDGDLDIVTVNGHAFMHPSHAARRQRPLVFANQANQRFRNVANQTGAYCSTVHDGRGLAAGDLDNDGDDDIVVSHLNEPVAVLRNDSAIPAHWLGLRLIGRTGSRDAMGATVRVRTSEREQTATVKSGGSYLSTGDRRVRFGLGGTTRIESIAIDWPGGLRQVLKDVTLDQYQTVVEPAAVHD